MKNNPLIYSHFWSGGIETNSVSQWANSHPWTPPSHISLSGFFSGRLPLLSCSLPLLSRILFLLLILLLYLSLPLLLPPLLIPPQLAGLVGMFLPFHHVSHMMLYLVSQPCLLTPCCHATVGAHMCTWKLHQNTPAEPHYIISLIKDCNIWLWVTTL